MQEMRVTFQLSAEVSIRKCFDDEDDFLGAICDRDQSEPWTIQLSFDSSSLELKIDTGVDVTMIPEMKYNSK